VCVCGRKREGTSELFCVYAFSSHSSSSFSSSSLPPSHTHSLTFDRVVSVHVQINAKHTYITLYSPNTTNIDQEKTAVSSRLGSPSLYTLYSVHVQRSLLLPSLIPCLSRQFSLSTTIALKLARLIGSSRSFRTTSLPVYWVFSVTHRPLIG
jgi:hypothetical protein